MAEARSCADCNSGPLERRNSSGFCGRCVGRHNLRKPGVREKIKRAARMRLAADPVAKAEAAERMRKVQALPQSKAARKKRWDKDKPWIAGNAAQPPGSEARRRAAKSLVNTRLAWCPPHLRHQYLELTQVKRMKAAEAREMILAQDRAEIERLRNRMGYEEAQPAPIGRPQVWPDCPEKLRPEYNRLRRNGMTSAEARRKLEGRAAAAG